MSVIYYTGEVLEYLNNAPERIMQNVHQSSDFILFWFLNKLSKHLSSPWCSIHSGKICYHFPAPVYIGISCSVVSDLIALPIHHHRLLPFSSTSIGLIAYVIGTMGWWYTTPVFDYSPHTNNYGHSSRIDCLSLRWHHNGRDCVSNHQPHNCLLNRLFGRRSK